MARKFKITESKYIELKKGLKTDKDCCKLVRAGICGITTARRIKNSRNYAEYVASGRRKSTAKKVVVPRKKQILYKPEWEHSEAIEEAFRSTKMLAMFFCFVAILLLAGIICFAILLINSKVLS